MPTIFVADDRRDEKMPTIFVADDRRDEKMPTLFVADDRRDEKVPTRKLADSRARPFFFRQLAVLRSASKPAYSAIEGLWDRTCKITGGFT